MFFARRFCPSKPVLAQIVAVGMVDRLIRVQSGEIVKAGLRRLVEPGEGLIGLWRAIREVPSAEIRIGRGQVAGQPAGLGAFKRNRRAICEI